MQGEKPTPQHLTAQISELAEHINQLKHQLQEVEILYQTSLEIHQQLNLDTMLNTIVQRAAQLLHTQMGSLFLVNADGDLELVVGLNQSGQFGNKIIPFGKGLTGTVAQTAQPLIIENYEQWEQGMPVSTSRIGRILGVPLLHNDKVIGVLNVLDETPGTFNQPQVVLLQKFANQAAIAIEKSRQLAEEREERLMAEVLHEISLMLNATLNSEAVLDQILYQINKVVPYDVGNVFLVKDGMAQIKRSHTTIEPATEVYNLLRNLVFTLEDTPNLRHIAETGQPLIIPDVRNYPGWVNEYSRLGYVRSWIGAPITAKGQLIGFLTLDKREPWFYQPKHADRLVTFANHAAIALENARLFEHTQHTLLRIKSLYEAGQWLTTDSLPEILQSTADNIAEILPADRVSLIILNTNKQQITHFVKSGPGSENIVNVSYQELWQGLTGYVLREQIPVLSSKHQPDLRESVAVRKRRADTQSGPIIVTPLIYQNETLGTITAINRPDQPDFTGTDVELLQAIANQTAIAIQNIRLFKESRRQANQLKTLHQLSRDLTILRDLDTLLYKIVERAIQLLQADAGAICLYRPAHNHLEWVVTIGDRIAHVSGTLQQGEGLSGTVWATGAPVIIPDYLTWAGRAERYGQLEGAVVGVPIRWGNRFLGVLVTLDAPQRKFTSNDATLLSQFAIQAAIALENARLHQTLQTQAQQLQQILDTVQDGIILLDSNQCVQLTNPAAQEYLTVLSDTPPNQPLTFLGTQSVSTVLSPLNNQQWIELTTTPNRPPKRIFEAGASPLTSGSTAGGWVIVLREVTEARKHQKQIRHQERLAAVGQLAAGIAHDFNNILTSIIGYTELIRAEPDISPSTKEDLGRIVQQSQRAAHLIRQILDFSRQSVSQKQLMDLSPFLKETVKLLERTIPENIAISLNIAANHTYRLNADPVQLQQALTNLAVNARDAMPNGGHLSFVLDTLTLLPTQPPPFPTMEPGNWIALSVTDTGTGIPAEILPHLFEPFFTTKEVGQGTGLGLAQVYGIVKQHHGFVDVKSNPEQGTTFTLYLPTIPELFDSSPAAETSGPVTGQGEMILLVEDNETVRYVTQTMLTSLGYHVIAADDGQTALELYQQQASHINLVMTDLTMPHMDGLALAQALKALNPMVKIIAMTGYPLKNKMQKLQAHGITTWVQKPVKLEHLAQIVHQTLH